MEQSLSDLRKIPENQLTPAQKLALFGPGNFATVKYRQIKQPDGSSAIVSRTFAKGEDIPEGWKDGPADFGVITHPSIDQRSAEAYDEVVMAIPAQPKAKAEKAA